MASFALQTPHQSLAHRLWLYAQSPRTHVFYPPGFAEEAEEVGPCTDREGPCLVLFKRTRLTPAEVNAWLQRNSSAAAAVVRVFWLGTCPGAAHTREELLAQLLAAGPAPGGGRMRLQCCPRPLEAWVGDQLPERFNLHPVDPAWVLHVVRVSAPPTEQQRERQEQAARQQQRRQLARDGHRDGAQREQAQPARQAERARQAEEGERFLFSLQPAAELYAYSPVRDKRVPEQMSKAAGKLVEALEASGLQPTDGVAVDLGAAPGGWTRVLAQRARRVVAVDPAALDPAALVPGVVTHLAAKAEDAAGDIAAIAGPQGVDLLVSDVNRHPSQAYELLRPLLPLLRPGGALVVTLKFFGRCTGRTEEWQARLAELLGPGFERVQLLWLLANTQHEQTCIAFRTDGPHAG